MIMIQHIIACSLFAMSLGVLHGDEQYTQVPDGTLLGFCNGEPQNGIHPSIDFFNKEGVLLKRINITTKFGGWADAVYMEKKECSYANPQLVLANDRGGFVLVIDTQTRQIIANISMGARPVHAYAIPEYQEYWSHSDGNGTFDVISINTSLVNLEHGNVVAHLTAPGHGKLLWDPELLPYGYASNTREPYVYEFDLSQNPPIMTRSISLSSSNSNLNCTGTHGMAYSNVNKHIYATCSGAGGLAEIDPSSRSSWNLVQIYRGLDDSADGGQVYESIDEKMLVLINKNGNKSHLIEPKNNAERSTQMFPDIMVAGNPDKVAFYAYKTACGKNVTRMFFSLTTPNSEDGMGGGVSFVDSSSVESSNDSVTATLIAAGNVKPGGYRTYRSILRAGTQIVVPTDYSPVTGTAAFSLIDAKTGVVKYARSNLGPSRMAWAPNTCGTSEIITPVWNDGADCQSNTTTPKGSSDSSATIQKHDMLMSVSFVIMTLAILY